MRSVVPSARRLKDRMACMGVRSSWDMLVRNCDLARFAASAESFAKLSCAVRSAT